jgi:hypothetical protein
MIQIARKETTMSEQTPNVNHQPEETHHHRTDRFGGWLGGGILITIGVLLLLRNFTGFYLNNWWALFILLPAVGAFASAGRNYQEAGRMTSSVRSSLFGGLVLVLVAAAFLFSLNWSLVGPMLLLLAGGALLVNSFLPR